MSGNDKAIANAPIGANAPIMRELIDTCTNMYRLGWNERNGGNISVLINEGEIEGLPDSGARQIDLGFDASLLAGKVYAVTGTGKYFKNVAADPALNLGLLKINPDGKTASVLWGFSDGGGPTSELQAHLRGHIVRLKQDPGQRVIMHCHATNILAMTLIHSLDEKEFTRTLWRMITECIVIFPDGIGMLPWMVFGTEEIGKATAAKLEQCRLCVWPQHGIFSAGSSLDECFGLIETVEKAALIYLKIKDSPMLNTITDDNLKSLAAAFKLNYRKDFLP